MIGQLKKAILNQSQKKIILLDSLVDLARRIKSIGTMWMERLNK